MPPAGHPAQRSDPGMPPANRETMPVHPQRTEPVNPAQYNPPMSGSADGADPAIMELPPIDAWRQAS
jgi:hypothetical protein